MREPDPEGAAWPPGARARERGRDGTPRSPPAPVAHVSSTTAYTCRTGTGGCWTWPLSGGFSSGVTGHPELGLSLTSCPGFPGHENIRVWKTNLSLPLRTLGCQRQTPTPVYRDTKGICWEPRRSWLHRWAGRRVRMGRALADTGGEGLGSQSGSRHRTGSVRAPAVPTLGPGRHCRSRWDTFRTVPRVFGFRLPGFGRRGDAEVSKWQLSPK